jgi:hypothetical protein
VDVSVAKDGKAGFTCGGDLLGSVGGGGRGEEDIDTGFSLDKCSYTNREGDG